MAETLSPSGIVVPNAGGGEAISTTGVGEMRLLGSTANTAFADARYDRGRIPNGSDVFTLASGAWTVSSVTNAETMTNLPEPWPGKFIIQNGDEPLVRSATFKPYMRDYSWETVADGAGTWVPWRKVGGYMPRNWVVQGEHFDDFRTTGDYVVRTSSVGLEVGGWPADAGKTTAWLSVRIGNPGTDLGFQMLQVFGSNGGVWWRSTGSISGSAPFPWAPWKRLDGGGGGGETPEGMSPLGSGVTNDLLVQDFSRRYGGVVDTGGRGAVALRIDHGLANYRDKVRPALLAAGMPAALILNSRNWDRAENDGVTPEIVNGWVQDGEVEIWNHGATHSNPMSYEAVIDEVVNGLAELRAQIPAAEIDGWAIPGVGSDPYMGFGSGTSVQQFYSSFAGRLILEHHAVSTGYMAGTSQRILDGLVRQGQGHYGLDSQTVANAKAAVDKAIVDRTGLQLFLHPSQLDLAGKTTTSEFEQIIEYVAQKRDAGELVILTPYQMMVADSTRPPVPTWDDLTGKPATYPSTIPEVDGLQAALPRIDTTVGTRVLLGDVMIHGETGKRDVTALFTSGLSPDNTGRILIFRRGSRVVIEFADALLAPGVGSLAWSGVLSSGWRPHQGSTFLSVVRWNSVNRLQAFTAQGSSVFWTAEVTVGANVASTNTRPAEVVRGQIEYDADGWPSSLPGDPV